MIDTMERPSGPAMLRGLRRRCPNCGQGALFTGYLAVRPECADCGEPYHHHRADDAPAWATMLIVGHLMVPLILAARAMEDTPVWVHMTVWPVVALALCLLMLPRIKGAVVGWQWAKRMHGFGDGRPD